MASGERLRLSDKRKSLAIVWTCGALAFCLTVVLAFATGGKRPVGSREAALIAILIGLLQVIGAMTASRVGRPDPMLARQSVRGLLRLAARVQLSRITAEKELLEGTPKSIKETLGVLSVNLSWIEEGLGSAVDDWKEFRADALSGLEGIGDE